ncbi:carboxypeptidase-like regulatory domain-containing protein [Tahibacter amnicola]|uniref:Carboxypeptidase-like regulatory domain-containing protein n=1 Tax=Tahibacter amnicola TaxID=2976241 RepID=A0ABY6BKX9_9GAMM|nr:carboxypeptidase-like regulatory domain-containing protein [Tahibacter amnicola]UXI70673.1 carboxypeptidase-like regulatory domain-containing protein [Tahibacter amnicola]
MLPEPFLNAFVTHTDANGRYAFESVEANTYAIDALNFFSTDGCPRRDRVRGRATGVVLGTQGQEVEANIQLIGQGQVAGTVTNATGTPMQGIAVRLTNPDPVYGTNVTCNGATTYDTVTDAQGNYSLPDVPPGDFTIAAQNADLSLRAEGRGRVEFDGHVDDVDLTLIDSAVTMPLNLHDANGFRFDIAGNGSIVNGTNNVYVGSGSDTGGMRLEIVQNGTGVPFTNGNGTLGQLSANGQLVEVDDLTPSGLTVKRRIFTPRAGYFTRYTEILRNDTAAPITVGVRVKSHFRNAQANARVVDTSDGDQVLSVAHPTLRDRWVVVDDQVDEDPFGKPSIQASGHLFDGDGATNSVASATFDLSGSIGRLTYEWSDVTVAPGEQVALMHFSFHQIDRATARDAATRLAQLPPEAIGDLTTDERQAIRNFVVPEQSAVQEPLPNLDAGVISGRVLASDGITPVPQAQVRFKSQHRLFGRVRYATTGNDGAYEFRSHLDGTASNAVIPVYGFSLHAEHPATKVTTSVAQGAFPPDAAATVQDLIFASTGNVRGSVKRHNGSVVSDAYVRLCRLDDRIRCSDVEPSPSNSATTDTAGTYWMSGNPPYSYFLFADKPHPQGGRAIYGRATATTTAADTEIADIVMEPTGSIAGVVKGANGTPIVNAEVKLSIDNPNSRVTRSDTAGRYRFTDVPVGQHGLHARDVVSGAQGLANATVTVDIETEQDIVLLGFGTLDVQVNYARGTPAGNSQVFVAGIVQDVKNADSNGVASFQLPVGQYHVVAHHPDGADPFVEGRTTASIQQYGDHIQVTATLLPAGAVHGTIVRPDGSTLAGGFPFSIQQIRGDGANGRNGVTAGVGNYRVGGLPLGTYLLTAYDAGQDRYAEGEFTIESDGQEVLLDLTLLDNRIALPTALYDANRFRFDVQRSGALESGEGTYSDAGMQLLINGQPFAGEGSARMEASRRQLVISQPTPIAGLNVSRKIYVPRGAYFARYIDVLENPTASPITVAVDLRSRYRTGSVIATSDSNAQVGANDRWVTIDDAVDADVRLAYQMPSSAQVFAGGATAPDVVSFDGLEQPTLAARWSTLSVPAGGRVALMHFAVQQINRAGAKASAERLVQLPPEVLADLAETDIAAIRNFAVPTDLASTLPPLPALTASVRGMVYEGDVRTPVRGARVTVQSTHPLFNRVWGMQHDDHCSMPGTDLPGLVSVSAVGGGPNPPPIGSFDIRGELSTATSIPLPEGVDARITVQETMDCFDQRAGHPTTKYPSRVTVKPLSTTHDLIFDTGVLTGTVQGPADFSVTSGTVYRSIDGQGSYLSLFANVRPDGQYVYAGLPAGRYDFLLHTTHPTAVWGDGGLRGELKQIQVNVGDVVAANVETQPTSYIEGAVLTGGGASAVNAVVNLSGAAAEQAYDQCATGCDAATVQGNKGKRAVKRQTRTDSLGRYKFAAVPHGGYDLEIIDPVSNAHVRHDVSVNGSPVVQNAMLPALGSAEVTVRTPAGTPAVDAYVYLKLPDEPERVAGRTDGAGRLTIANIPQGNYRVRVVDPRYPNDPELSPVANGSIAVQGEVDPIALAFKALMSLQIAVIDSTAGGAPVSGASIRLVDARGERLVGNTNAQGLVTANAVVEGAYTVLARVQHQGLWKQLSAEGVVAPADDGQSRVLTFDAAAAGDRPDILAFEGERRLFAVMATAGQRIDVTAGGQEPDNCAIRTEVYSPGLQLLAEGYGFSSGNTITQYNEFGDLHNVVAAVPGAYTIAISARFAWCPLGGYSVGASVDTVATPLMSYQGGGSVTGHVYRRDGATPVAGARLRLRSALPELHTEVLTGSDGLFRVDNVPLGTFTLKYMPPANVNVAVEANGDLPAAGSTVERDLVLPASTIFAIQVRKADGSPYGQGVSLELASDDAFNYAQTDAQGRVNYTHYSDLPLRIRARDPSNGNMFVQTIVQPADGQTVPVEMTMAAAAVGGQVLDVNGVPVPYARVQMDDVANGNNYTSGSTDHEGRFLFNGVPSGVVFAFQGVDPDNSVHGEAVQITTVAGQTAEVTLRLAGHGTVSGTVRRLNGTPLSDATVDARYFFGNGEGTQMLSTTTDGDGRYSIDHLPVGQALSLRATVYTPGDSYGASASATIAAHGGTATADFDVDLPGGSVDVRVRSADDARIEETCQVWLRSGSGDANRHFHCSRPVAFHGVAAGQADVEVNVSSAEEMSLPSQTVAVTANESTVARFTVPVVKGHVRYAGGDAVSYPSVNVTGSDGQTRFAQSDDDGTYRLLVKPDLGDFVVRAQDDHSGLSASVSGSLGDVTVPSIVDVLLPSSGTVRGLLTDTSTQPVPNASVFVSSSGSAVDRETSTDDDGRYEVDRVALGHVDVAAIHPTSNNIAAASGQLSANNQVLTLNPQFGVPGSVSGTVRNAQGDIVADACVELRSTAEGPAYATVSLSTTTDAAGHYAFDAVVAGPVSVVADNCNAPLTVGVATGGVAAGAPTTIDVQFGNAVSAEQALVDSQSDYTFLIDGYGTLSPYLTESFNGRPYEGAYRLRVNGRTYPYQRVGLALQNGRELQLGPVAMSGLRVTRRFYVPADGGYARIVDTFSNETGAPVTVPIAVEGQYQSSPAYLRTAPSATGGRYAVLGQMPARRGGWSSPGVAGLVFAGSGAVDPPQVTITPDDGGFRWQWTPTIAAGQRVSYVHFAVVRGSWDFAGAGEWSGQLADMAIATMFDGLSPAERESIKNFTVQ